MAAYDYRYDYRDGKYYRNAMHPDGIGVLPEYENSNGSISRTAYHRHGMGVESFFGSYDDSIQNDPALKKLASSTSSTGNSTSYNMPAASSDGDWRGGTVSLVFIGLALIFTEATGITNLREKKPVVTQPYRSNAQPFVSKAQAIPKVQYYDIGDLYSDFISYYKTDDSPINLLAQKISLPANEIASAISKAYYKAVDSKSNLFTVKDFFPTVKNFKVLLKENLSEIGASDTQIAMIVEVVDVELNQKIAQKMGIRFNPEHPHIEEVPALETEQADTDINIQNTEIEADNQPELHEDIFASANAMVEPVVNSTPEAPKP